MSLRRRVINYPYLRMYVWNFLIFCKSALRRKKIVDITGAVLNRAYFSRTCNIDNSYYGIALTNDDSKKREVYYEHGFFWGDIILDAQKAGHVKKIYTLSQLRVDMLKRRLGVDVELIKPYILHFEMCAYTATRLHGFINNGGYILFIPGHSTKDNSIHVSVKEGKRYINLLHYIDYERYILLNRINATVTTCGNSFDPQFLPRLRSLIEGSEYVETDFLGTHILYAHSLGVKIKFIGNLESMRNELYAIYQSYGQNVSLELFEENISFFMGLMDDA